MTSYAQATKDHVEIIAAIRKGIDEGLRNSRFTAPVTVDEANRVKIALHEAGFKIVRDKK